MARGARVPRNSESFFCEQRALASYTHRRSDDDAISAMASPKENPPPTRPTFGRPHAGRKCGAARPTSVWIKLAPRPRIAAHSDAGPSNRRKLSPAPAAARRVASVPTAADVAMGRVLYRRRRRRQRRRLLRRRRDFAESAMKARVIRGVQERLRKL